MTSRQAEERRNFCGARARESMTSRLLTSFPGLNILQLLVIFGNLRKFSEIVGSVRKTFGQYSKNFGNAREKVGNIREIVNNVFIGMFVL